MCRGLRPREDEREKAMVVPWVVLWVEVSCVDGLRSLVVWVCGGLGGDIKWVLRIKKN